MKLLLPAPEQADGSTWYSTAESTSFPAHVHDELELNVVVRGEAHYAVEGRSYRLSPRSMIWFLPQRVHELVHVSPDFVAWVFSFRPRLVESLRPLLPGLARSSELAAWSLIATPEQARAITRLGHQFISRRELELGNRVLGRVLLTAGQGTDLSTPEAPGVHPAVDRAALLAGELEYTGSTSALARRCGISPTRLSHLFTEQMGVPLVHYRNHRRVQAFIRSFGDGSEQKMLSTALEVGFGSYAQFHRAFRQVTGYGPRRHLMRVREGIIRPEKMSALARH